MLEPVGRNIENEHDFLAAWKAAINVTGKLLYNVRSPSVEAATDKNDLRPDFDAIEQFIRTTPGDHQFLIAVVQFFSYKGIEDICTELEIPMPNLTDLAWSLNADQKQILCRLINYYCGW